MDLNELLYTDLPCDTFAQRLKKAKLMAGFTQKSLAAATGLSLSTINELEAGYRDTISRDTLLKLINVLDEKILCDDYCKFILNQTNNLSILLNTYTLKKLSQILSVHITTVERWFNGDFQISRKQYEKIINLSH